MPNTSQYRVQSFTKGAQKFIKPAPNVKFVSKDYWTSPQVKEDLHSNDCLIIHYMNRHFANTLKYAKNDMLIGWIGWGGDYYPYIQNSLPSFILPKTRQIYKERFDKQYYGFDAIKNTLLEFFKLARTSYSNQLNKNTIHKTINRLDFLWVNPEDMPAFENTFHNFNRCYHRLFYYSAEETFEPGPARFNGPDILIGNSATPTNNHLDLLELLRLVDLDNRQIIMPLNYGDKDYANKVVTFAKRLFGTRVRPLLHYMTLQQYHSEISTCSTVLMNHVRQQAATTISTSLYKGARIFLRNENTLRRFYRQLGIKTQSIQDDLARDSNWCEPLTEEETSHNRKQLKAYWGHDVAITQIKQLCSMIAEKKAS